MHDNIQEAPACSICFEKFSTTNQPHLLLCFHTFCQKCLQTMIKSPLPHTPSDTQPFIICPLCSKGTPCATASSLPLNFAVKDIAEEASAATQGRCCEIHDEVHPATYWCFECEQGLCDEAQVMHTRTKATKQHETNKIGTELRVSRHQVLCDTHGKELDLVCAHDSHPPRMVCVSCIVTSHQTHRCVTATDYFAGKKAEMQALLVHGKASEARMSKGAAAVAEEKLSLVGNKDAVMSAINSYFVKAHTMLDDRQKELIAQLEYITTSKERILQQQEKSLLASYDGIRNESLQLERALGATSQAKALVLMQQLHKHLKSVKEVDVQPRELAAVGFYEAPLVLPEVHLVDAAASAATVTSTKAHFPVVLSTVISLDRFEITGRTKKAALKPMITNIAKGKYEIRLDPGVQDYQMVEVKLFGQHIKGSPIEIFNNRNWEWWTPSNLSSSGATSC